jgi:tripartite-type tricarboxylate transporter receptor subunit TctC
MTNHWCLAQLRASSQRRWRPSWMASSLFGIALLALCGGEAWSQTPQSMRIIVPFAPGGGADILARLVAEEIGRAQKISVVVENRAGGGTVPATEAVAHATPDGSTLLMNANSFVINPSLRKLSYDPLAAFEPLCNLVGTPMFIVVGRNSPYRTLTELLDAARARPGELNLASLGPATAQHIAFELLKRRANVNMSFIAYPGNVPAINALMGGHVTSALANFPEIVEHINAGNLRVLATTTRARFERLPETPTIAESGFDGYAAEVWLGLVAPAQTPPDTLSRIISWSSAAMQTPAIKARLNALGLLPKSMCGTEFAAYMRSQRDDYARILRDANIKAE